MYLTHPCFLIEKLEKIKTKDAALEMWKLKSWNVKSVCLFVVSPVRDNTPFSFRCEAVETKNGSKVCEWTFTGKGFQYDLLAGPIFIVCYTLAGIVFGFAADVYNRYVAKAC